MKYQLVALDVDGTLINDNMEVLPKTKEMIKRIYEDGIMISLCTGRNPDSTLPLMEQLDVEGPVVVHNGAISFHSSSRHLYSEIGYQKQELEALINFCRAKGLHFDVNTAFDIYVENINPELERLYESYFARPIVVNDVMEIQGEIIKLSILEDEDHIVPILNELWDMFPQLRITRSGENYIDVIHPSVNKGKGLGIVCDQLGIPLDHVIAIGNYYNDIEMLRMAGLGIAMGNSPDQVKQVAKAVTKSNNEEGIYHALKKYIY